MKLFVKLFATFAKVGVMTFGGGYAMLAGVIEAFSHIVWVQNAFGGICICV